MQVLSEHIGIDRKKNLANCSILPVHKKQCTLHSQKVIFPEIWEVGPIIIKDGDVNWEQ